MAITVRTRFEVFKRDEFRCQYCGRRSPEVVLEVDHIVPGAAGGSDDPINLRASCWDCNRGKSDTPLDVLITGEDPHDRAVLLLERERQLREYNTVLAEVNARVGEDWKILADLWNANATSELHDKDAAWLYGALLRFPREIIRRAMEIAFLNHKSSGLAYVNACLRNWSERGHL